PRVRVNAITSLVRLGDEQGTAEARDLLLLPDAERTGQVNSLLFVALERAAPAPKVLEFVRSVRGQLGGAERLAADSILVLHGTEEERRETQAIRAVLPDIGPYAPELQTGVRALSRAGAPEDVETMATLFRRENTPQVTQELAVGLAKVGHADAWPLLLAAAEQLPWNQGLLALGSARHVGGDETLLMTAADALGAGNELLARRIGWALGVWSDGKPWVGTEGGAQADSKAGPAAGSAAGSAAGVPGWRLVEQAALLGRLNRTSVNKEPTPR
ncbi:MAG: hypothetical protein AAGG01_10750, partial [Planctomycetota bacterium]